MTLELNEPIVRAMITLLSSNLPAEIDSLNATVTDGYVMAHPALYLPYVPIPSSLSQSGGAPIIGIVDMPARFTDDLQFSMHALHEYAVLAMAQNSDHATLTWQLRRYTQAIANVIQADRLLGKSDGTGGIMRSVGGAWSVNFIATVPGPLLGDVDPLNVETPPSSWISWTSLHLSSERQEI